METTVVEGERKDFEPVTINILINKDEQSTISALVFDLEDIKKLRQIGICGILTGTLPSASQQNTFLSIPLRLMVEEVLWLHFNGYCHLRPLNGPISQNVVDTIKTRAEDLYTTSIARIEFLYELQRQYKREEHLKKLEKLGLLNKNVKEGQEDNLNSKLLESSLFVQTSNASSILQDFSMQLDDKFIINWLISNSSSWNNYLLFKSLKDQKYILAPGSRFGGKFIAYPGDPLRYHSHLTVQNAIDYYNEPIDMLSLIRGSRLGTTVKKLWVVGGVKGDIEEEPSTEVDSTSKEKNGRVSFFSIEWAAFG
ncbi:tRNA splicing endonuclease subunit SEN34 NDAI_0J01870 [Naumovozyma dairenensis CBS 421]|uniref:tRNA-splicing endonuclease subunit Sen34 n=1 Tax=Naumovozyma dairenensis (strain ATCC 10597 / BCRC 20456 / CBS 421 / NBRC 0211 / NRRL Y-12639) TaxID=1071378 RepID=G0WH01_NAUDC|nr:hypothetical protein NDAI_0J01870 [Naumovozyma dairenensis CBS 421]CCD27079.1 hypothetical protein NDAI_0J01870 [Naumovozyma dairenensis CBS 421]